MLKIVAISLIVLAVLNGLFVFQLWRVADHKEKKARRELEKELRRYDRNGN